ncbi:unnamed protein product [Blepharisma stoltei]|uniref:Uncharacterized protein n=1 Tax=Blepharisma stoltei TaxID=1481888 RepID=A0AAU9IYI8_9CILI|nr:unnamed protein product [Blepharisma stoltei]
MPLHLFIFNDKLSISGYTDKRLENQLKQAVITWYLKIFSSVWFIYNSEYSKCKRIEESVVPRSDLSWSSRPIWTFGSRVGDQSEPTPHFTVYAKVNSKL